MEQNKKILIIEDDTNIREIIRLYLNEEGYTVIESKDGNDIIPLIIREKPSLITLDLNLPEIDGRQIINMIKQNESIRGIPIVIVSIAAKDSRLQNLSQKYLSKPFDKKELIDTINDILQPKKEATKSRKVLVVDDEPDIVDIVSTHVEDLGFESLKAFNGQEAIEKATKEKPDLIILDIQMPKLNGFEVINALNKDKETLSIPIIVLTGNHVPSEEQEKRKKMGVAQFLTKPFESDRLTQEIQKVLKPN